MSLNALGQYGSDSSISDSDEEEARKKPCVESYSSSLPADHTSPSDHTLPPPPPADPLGLLEAGSDSSSTSDSDKESPPSRSNTLKAATPLPLPDIDRAVARNASYSDSELVRTQSTLHEGTADSVEDKTAGESSVFFNRYKREEEARLAVLKQHVSEFDKKPELKAAAREDCSIPGGFSHTSIPPPTTYARHGGGGSTFPSSQHDNRTFAHTTRPHTDRSSRNMPRPPPDEPPPLTGSDLFDDNDSSSFAKKPRKHRSGVGDSLRPPKKFMKMHEKIQAQERPWTLK